jgi:hypothetical protein
MEIDGIITKGEDTILVDDVLMTIIIAHREVVE